MPANLPPDYFEAEKRYRSARSPEDKIQALKEMLAIMPKHKGTDKLQAELRRRIARHKDEMEIQRERGGRRRSGLDSIPREGAAQLLLVGLPNSGKSSLIEAVTNATPEVAEYPFTTRRPLPAMMRFEDVQIQLVDLPPVAEESVEPWMVSLLRNTDSVLLVVDSDRDPLRDIETITDLLTPRKVSLLGFDLPAVDEWSPVAYKRALVVANKVDLEAGWARYEGLARELAGKFEVVPFSCYSDELVSHFPQRIFRFLRIIRVYTKVPGKKPDLGQPYVLPEGSCIMDLASEVHRDFVQRLRFARVWGSGRFEGQNVEKDYIMGDRDIVELHM